MAGCLGVKSRIVLVLKITKPMGHRHHVTRTQKNFWNGSLEAAFNVKAILYYSHPGTINMSFFPD
jgi:hypothetical protein